MNEGMNLVREIARVTGWANDITERRSRGEAIRRAELGEYQRAKVEVLAEIASRNPSTNAEEVLAAVTARRPAPRPGGQGEGHARRREAG